MKFHRCSLLSILIFQAIFHLIFALLLVKDRLAISPILGRLHLLKYISTTANPLAPDILWQKVPHYGCDIKANFLDRLAEVVHITESPFRFACFIEGEEAHESAGSFFLGSRGKKFLSGCRIRCRGQARR